MELAIIIVIVAVSAALLIKGFLGKAGIGRQGGKPDCGCGTCADKREIKRKAQL